MFICLLPCLFLVIFGISTECQNDIENCGEDRVPDTRVYTKEELLAGFVRKVDYYLDILSEVYQNKSNTQSQMTNAICQCASTVFNYDLQEKRATQCEHIVNRLPLIEAGSFSRNYVYMADQLKSSVIGQNLQTHGIIIYACRRSSGEFLDMPKEIRNAMAKELFRLETMPLGIIKKLTVMEMHEKFRELSIEKARTVARTFLRSPSEDTNTLKQEMDGLVEEKLR